MTKSLEEDLESADVILSAQELGRLAQLEGDFQKSIRYYKRAFKPITKLTFKP